MKAENRSCFECATRNPTWISLTYGIYLCLECSGEHRRKGVHLSFVRSVELDKFSIDQIVQMAAGGNGKAAAYFKQHGMGKVCGKQVDYTSKTAMRYRQQLEKEAHAVCDQYSVACKGSAAAAHVVADPVDQEAEKTTPPAAATNTKAVAGLPSVVKAQSAPKASTPTTVIIRKAGAEVAAAQVHHAPTEDLDAAMLSAASLKPASSSVARPTKAKEMDFEFDWDDLEAEANKPAPKAAPAPAAVTAPSRATPKSITVQSAAPARKADMSDKFVSAKHISSEDFFEKSDGETATERHDREVRYDKFTGSQAISSAAFFGDEGNKRNQNGNEVGNSASEIAQKGKDMFFEYLSKVRD